MHTRLAAGTMLALMVSLAFIPLASAQEPVPCVDDVQSCRDAVTDYVCEQFCEFLQQMGLVISSVRDYPPGASNNGDGTYSVYKYDCNYGSYSYSCWRSNVVTTPKVTVPPVPPLPPVPPVPSVQTCYTHNPGAVMNLCATTGSESRSATHPWVTTQTLCLIGYEHCYPVPTPTTKTTTVSTPEAVGYVEATYACGAGVPCRVTLP